MHTFAALSPTVPLRRQRTRLLTTSFLAGAVLVAGCADESPLLEVPSQMSVAAAPSYAQAVDSARAAARRYVRTENLPGVSIAVGRSSEVVWAEAFGWADLSSEILATPRTLYPVGSISKSLTATAAGLLWERGRLDFDVPIQTYLPEFPEKKWPITTGQLMGHIAGVVRSSGMADILRQPHCEDARSAIQAVVEDTLIFEPGTEYSYSNFGWRLVGAVVEAAAGEPYLEFMDREVFTPAGMELTVPDLGDEPGEAVKYDRAMYGTLRRGQDIDMSCSMAPGGFLSTPTELVQFGYAMLNGELLDSATVERFWTPQRLASGAPTSYGYGWGVGNVALGAEGEGASTRVVQHGGSVLGGRASLMIFPDEDLVVSVMTNAAGDVSGLATEIARFFRNAGREQRSDRVGALQ
ncbi:MAG TPA: serine hydrolase domain-containing protein [Longimicrobiales bacterium]|nr:serine hydrolase domain-containing protein [Longimicrobiales bacterium]